MADEIPQWAKEWAMKLCLDLDPDNYARTVEAWEQNGATSFPAFARYIMEHEEPPVDPVKAATADAFRVIWDENEYATCEAWSERMHAELEKRGLKIVPADDSIELGRASK